MVEIEPIAAAKALVEERFPECLAAFVGGSVIAGRGTPTSDLDMVVITTREEAPYRESLRYEGWPVELFVHNIRQEARRLIEEGPELLSQSEFDFRRYMLTDLLDDFTGSTRPEETAFIAASLVEAAIDQEAVQALEVFYISKSRDPLLRFATKALNAAGGRLFEGFRQAGRRSGQ